MPPANAEVTAFSRRMSAALSIGGMGNLTARSRHCGRTRSMHGRNAVGVADSASFSTA